MAVRKFAMIGGILMIAMGVLAFVPALNWTIVSPVLTLDTSYGLFLGYFPMNILNKIALIAFGIWGVSVANASNVQSSIDFSRTVFAVMGVLAVLGVIPSTATLGGYWPLYGGEVFAHAVFTLFGGYFGYVLPARSVRDEHVIDPERPTPVRG